MKKNFTQLINKVESINWQTQVVGLLLLFMMLVSQTALGQTTEIYRDVFDDGSRITATLSRGTSSVVSQELRIVGLSGNPRGYEGYIVISNPITFYQDISYSISIKARASAGAPARLEITSGASEAEARNATGNRILSSPSNNIGTSDITISTAYTVPTTQTRYIGFFVTHTATNSPTLSLDDIIITATCNSLPAAPSTTPNSRCGDGTVQLFASGAPNGGSYRWYTAQTGGTAIANATGATYTTPNLTQTTSYWVSTVSPAGCESATRTEVVATVNPIPVTPTVSSNARCGTGIVTLAATVGDNGTIVRWYEASSGGTPIATGPSYETPAISATTTYYVSSFNADTNCESARVPIVATVNPIPTVTLSDFAPICVSASTITLSGGSPAGGTYSGNGVANGVFDPAIAGVGDHVITYTYTDGNSCTSSSSKTIEVTAAPVVSLEAFDPVCENSGAFALTGGLPVGGTFRVNGVIATQFNPATAGDGEHTITYTVTQNGCSVTATQTIVVNPTPNVSFLPVSPVCIDAGAFELTSGRVGGAVPTTGTWSYSGRGVSDGLFSPSAAGAGSHTITYTYTSSEGCTNTATQSIVVNALPNVTLSNFSDVCVSASPFTLGGGSPAGGTYSGTGVTSGVFSPAAAGVGEHTITYTYTNANGCTSTATNTITVKPLPVISVTSSLAICAGGSAILTASGATSYRWEPATGLSATTGATVTASPAQTTTYTVYGITDGCESEARTVTVTVNPLPSATITPTGPTNFCEGNSVILNAPTGSGYTYEWYLDGGTEVYSEERSISVASSGSYTVKVTNSFGCSTTSSPIEVIVVEIDPNVATITNTGSLTFCQGGSVLLQAAAAPSGQVYEYQWQVNSGGGNVWQDIEENATGRTFRAEASGRYRVVVTNVPQDGEAQCSKTSSSLTVTVNPLPIADAGESQTLCAIAGSSTVFTMAGTATNGTGVWTVVNGSQTGGATASITNAGSPNATVSVSGAGSVKVRYTVTSNASPSCGSDSKEITLTVSPLPVANAGPDQTLCATGATTIFTLGGSVTNGTGVWSVVSGNASIANTSSMTSTVTVTGTGSVVLLLTSTSNTNPACGSATDQVTLTVNPLPTANAGANQSKCATGSSTTFNLLGSVTNGTGAWSVLSGNATLSSTTSMTPTVTVTGTGTVVVRLTTTSTANPVCTAATDDISLVVYTTPTAAVTPASPAPACGGSVILTATSSPANAAYTYQWFNQSGAISGATQSAYSASASGSYHVVITNPQGEGCASAVSNTVQVTVNPVPAAPTNVATSAAAVCGSGSVTLTATAGTNANSVRWYSANTGGTLLATALSYSPNVTATTTFFAASYNTTTGCESSTRVPVTITANPIPGAPTNVGVSSTSVCGSGSVTLSATVGTNASVVRWYDASSGGNLLATGATHTRTVTQTTTFYAASYNPTTNCESSTRTSVTVTSNTPIATPSITNLTPNKTYYTAETFGGNPYLVLTGSAPGAGNTGVFSGPGVELVGSNYRFTPCSALASGAESANISITYTVRSNSTNCENSVTVPITVKRSTYTTIVTADPFPTCRGQNTTFTAKVYRDAEVIYPYLVNDQGIPVKSDMVTPLGRTEYPLPNPAYFDDPSSIPQILWINTYRYYQPKIVSGTLMDATLFDYAWTKNMDGTQFANSPSINNAGLSSLDYFAVYVTNKNIGTTCAPAINRKISNRVYTAAPVAYEVTLNSNRNIICQGGTATVSADLNSAFDFWGEIGLTLYLMHRRNGVVTQLEARPYRTGDADPVQFSTNGGLVGGLQNGDELYVEFSSVIDQHSEVRNKCSQDFMTNIIRVTVVGEQALTAGAARCVNGAGVPVGLTTSQQGVLYQLRRDGTNVGTPIVGTGNAITFGNFTEAGTYSVQAFAGTEACLVFGATVINVTPLPLVQTLTAADNGAYCAGGSGVILTLGGSQNNVSYQLRRTVGSSTTNVGSPITGNGQPIVFPAQTIAGTYTVVATTVASNGVAGGCSQTMNNVQVVVNPLPLAQTFTGGGSYCAGSGGVPIGLRNSQSGITYNLKNSAGSNVATIEGTGGSITFGNFTAGTYSIEAVNRTTTCSLNMAGTIQVTENPLPTTYSVTGGGRFCADGTGVPVGLGNSQTGVSYQLVRTVNGSSENVGSPVSGTGGAITFGPQSATGVYSVVATSNTTPPCPIPMNGIATITIDELPMEIAAVSGEYCDRAGATGAEISLPSSQVGVSYQLVNSRNENIGSSMAGNGGPLSFGQQLEGVYRIVATNTTTSCSRVLSVPEVIANPIITATGDILIFDEEGVQVLDARDMKVGVKYTFRVKSNILDANDTDMSSIKWYMGDGLEENWKLVHEGSTEFTMSEPMGALQVSIRCEIPTNPGTCYDVLANLFRLSTEIITPLPVELIYFKAEKRGNDVAMEWATASEKDNKGFEVQVSTDGKNFRSLGFVESRVINTSIKQVYTFVDKENGKYGTRYYRLKQIDLDGKFEYFSTKAIQFGAVVANKVKAYPNPFHSEVELSIDAEVEAEVLVTVTNATGQQLLQRTIKVEKGSNIEKLTLDPTLPRGIYIISTRMGELNSHFKLLKQ